MIVTALDGEAIFSDGLTFANLVDIEKVERYDVLCIPGGVGCIPAMENRHFMQAIRRLASEANYLTSVCTGSLVLGAAGVLKGRRSACHWAWRDMLSALGAMPEDGRVIRDGNVITGGGATAGVDFALILIAKLWRAETAQRIQLLLEYAPAPPFDAGLPETAPSQVRQDFLDRMTNTLEDARRRVGVIVQQHTRQGATMASPSH